MHDYWIVRKMTEPREDVALQDAEKARGGYSVIRTVFDYRGQCSTPLFSRLIDRAMTLAQRVWLDSMTQRRRVWRLLMRV